MIKSLWRIPLGNRSVGEEDTCVPYEEEDTCVPYEEEDTCVPYEKVKRSTKGGGGFALDRPFLY